MTLSVKDLKKSFGGKYVLNGVSFDVREGEVFAIIGPNGVGKTTTLKCIYGEYGSFEGEITVFGERSVEKVKDRIAVVSEKRYVPKGFRGKDLVSLWRLVYPKWREDVFGRMAVHHSFNLEEPFENYSMGIKTLFLISLALASGAELLILDEPTQHLDPAVRIEVMGYLRSYSGTILVSSHEIYELEEIADSFAIMYEGEIVYTDSVDGAKEGHRLISPGERIPRDGEIVGTVGDSTLVRTEENVGRYPNLKEIVVGYLNGKRASSRLAGDLDGIIL